MLELQEGKLVQNTDLRKEAEEELKREEEKRKKKALVGSLIKWLIIGALVVLLIVGIVLPIKIMPNLLSNFSKKISGGLATKSPTATTTPQNIVDKKNVGFATSTEKQTPVSTTTTATSSNSARDRTPDLSPDLALSNVKVGVLGPNGQFVESASMSVSSTLIIMFTISNQGGPIPAGWVFDAYLPTQSQTDRVSRSPAQRSLVQNAGLNNTLTVTGLISGYQTISIILDPNAVTKDSNRNNNRVDVPITIY